MPCPSKPAQPTPIQVIHTSKGCIHWFDASRSADPAISSQKARPHIIIGADNPGSQRVLISPISDRVHYVEAGSNVLKYPYHAEINLADNPFLDKDSVILLDQIHTISKADLCEEWYMGKISNPKDLDESLIYNFDLFETIYRAYKEMFEGLQGLMKQNHKKRFSRK